jgi:hypothetical protein
MNVVRTAFVVLLTVPRQEATQPPESPAREVALEQIIRRVVSDMPAAQRRPILCLRTTDKDVAGDPSDALLRRLSDMRGLRKGSSCVRNKADQVLVTVWPLEEAGQSLVRTKARLCWGDVCGPIMPYLATKTSGQWAATQDLE